MRRYVFKKSMWGLFRSYAPICGCLTKELQTDPKLRVFCIGVIRQAQRAWFMYALAYEVALHCDKQI